MKHFKTYLLCLGLALTTASCSQDDFESNDTASDKLIDMSFTAGTSQPVTRTVLGEDGSTVTWQTNDQIGIGYYRAPGDKSLPFKTPSTGSDVIFWGQAADINTPYYMMYPYQEDAKILHKNNVTAEYQYTFPKNQQAVAGTFDPKANVSVGIIPNRTTPFIAYNVGGLLRFSINGVSNVKQVKLIAVGQENLAGKLKSTITFASNGKISNIRNQFNEASPVVNLTAESGSLEENKAYYIALPEQKLSQGLTLVFILQDGKSILKKVKQEVNIQRAKVYNLGEMSLDATKAKAFILKNQPLIDAVAAKVSGLKRKADGNLDIYDADNLEKILSYKGILTIKDNDKLTSIDELQYYRNVTSISLENNKNLAGELNFNKYPQLTNSIVVSNSPLVTKIDITGLDKLVAFHAHHMDNLTEVTIGNNPKLWHLSLYDDKLLEKVDASNLPALTNLNIYSNPKMTSANTTNSPNIKNINALYSKSLTNIDGLSENTELEVFWAAHSKIESYDFSKMTKLRNVNLASSAVKEIKGLSAAGANLKELQLSITHISSLDVSNNPELQKIDVYGVKELTKLDVTNNTKLISLRTSLASNIRELKLGDNTELQELLVSHNKLTALDIRKFQKLTKLFAGSQSPNGFLANIVVTMTQAQKDKFGDIFTENAKDATYNGEFTNSYVKVVVAP